MKESADKLLPCCHCRIDEQCRHQFDADADADRSDHMASTALLAPDRRMLFTVGAGVPDLLAIS
jgi:hypothetical protein